jgi:PAS domain S-box-containing protein
MSNAGEAIGDRVLVVDDDSSIGHLMDAILRREGYEPAICTHPHEALDVLEKERFGLVFVDINLPEMNGLELGSNIKKRDPTTEVVFITGHGSFENAIQAIRIGAYDYLRKPFGIDEMHLCLRRFEERQALKKQIKHAEQRYSDLVENIPSILFVVQKDFRLEFINRASQSILGYFPQEALDNPDWFLERIHPTDVGRMKRLFLSAFQSRGSQFSAECRLIHRDGHLIHGMIRSISPIESENKQGVDRLEGIILDITDRIFGEQARVQKERLNTLDSISAEVAHAIRNPLVSIGGFARRIQNKLPELPEGKIILRESKRLEEILSRITAYLKPVDMEYEKCSVNEVIRDCVKDLSSEINREGLECQLDLSPSLSVAYLDRDLVSQIFAELIRNALEKSAEPGTVYIRTFEGEDNLHVEFKNPAAELELKNPEQPLMPFDDSEQETSLSLSYRLLRNMGGLLSFARDRSDMIFTVSLPKRLQPAS